MNAAGLGKLKCKLCSFLSIKEKLSRVKFIMPNLLRTKASEITYFSCQISGVIKHVLSFVHVELFTTSDIGSSSSAVVC